MNKISPLHKGWLLIATMVMFTIILTGCGSQSDDDQSKADPDESAAYPEDVEENPIVTMTMENDEEITIELYPDIAPNTVANFVSLVEDGFYD